MSENLEKLRALTNSLSVRDKKRIQELELYQSFFSSIPVKTFVWSVDSSLKIRVKNKKSLKDPCVSTVMPNGTINDVFSCDKMNELNISMHQSALNGNTQLYLVRENDIMFLTSLIPVDEGENTVVYGCSWDVTNIVKIIQALRLNDKNDTVNEIKEVTDGSEMSSKALSNPT